jgi:carbonic anhydrase
MLRLKNLKVLFPFGSKRTVSNTNQQTHPSDKYRKKYWDKYFVSFYTLLASNTFYGNRKNELLSVGFTKVGGGEYIYPGFVVASDIVPHNLDKIVYSAVVNRPKIIWLPCMDERIQYLTASHHALSLGMPGCECLLSQKEKEKIIGDVVEICEKNKTIEEIVVSSHSGCGAVAAAIRAHKNEQTWYEKIIEKFETEEALIDKNGEKFAASFASILESKMLEKALNVNIRTHHFVRKELHSKHIHNAFGAVVNLDPLLNTAEFEDSIELPMFNIYSRSQSANQIFDNIFLAIAIASGDHGFGPDYFTKQTPFTLLFTTNLSTNLESSMVISDVLEMLKVAELPLEVIYKVLDTSN